MARKQDGLQFVRSQGYVPPAEFEAAFYGEEVPSQTPDSTRSPSWSPGDSVTHSPHVGGAEHRESRGTRQCSP